MRRLMWILGLVLAPTLAAQADSAGPIPADSTERERLQEQIEQRFSQAVQRQLGLSESQAARLRATEERFRPRRRSIMRSQLEMRLALEDQMRPGEAANADSVRKLMDRLQANRGELLRLEQEQNVEMQGYLTPVQQARYQMMRERLIRRLAEVRRERVMGGGRRPGAMRPRDGPRRRPRG